MENTKQILDGNLIDSEITLNPDDNLASMGKRFLNSLIDTIAYYAIVFVMGMVAVLSSHNLLIQENLTIFALILMFLYFVVFESLFGKTLGKLITKTKVVMEDGSKPSFTRIMGRSLCRFIPFDGLSYLGGSIGWHDKFSKTRVVNDN